LRVCERPKHPAPQLIPARNRGRCRKSRAIALGKLAVTFGDVQRNTGGGAIELIFGCSLGADRDEEFANPFVEGE